MFEHSIYVYVWGKGSKRSVFATQKRGEKRRDGALAKQE